MRKRAAWSVKDMILWETLSRSSNDAQTTMVSTANMAAKTLAIMTVRSTTKSTAEGTTSRTAKVPMERTAKSTMNLRLWLVPHVLMIGFYVYQIYQCLNVQITT